MSSSLAVTAATPDSEVNAPPNASVIPYPASVVGFPVREANDCAGTLDMKPESFVKSLTLVGIVGVPVKLEYGKALLESNASVIPYPAIVVGVPVIVLHACAGTEVK